MAGHLSYEDSKKAVWKGLALLAGVTLAEVALSLMKAAEWAENLQWLFVIASLLIIVLSVYKAYFIIYEFMHMGYEVKGLAMTVLLPMFLLVWALIAFFSEGDYWKENRAEIEDRNQMESMPGVGAVITDEDFVVG